MSFPPLPRDQFPVAEHLGFFNHAGIAPLSRVAVEEIERCATDFARRGSVAFDEWDAQQEDARRSGARLMGVEPHTVALVKNTTEGLSFVANGLDWAEGDRVIVPDLEFPSTIYPWLALRDRGVSVEVIAPVGTGRTLPLEVFEEALDRAPARVLALSWVQYGRGHRVDLAALADLCHERGTLLCVDVIQGLGVIPAELATWGVDFAAADAHKWLLGPLGVGLFYVAEQHLELLRPSEPGWAAVAHRDDYDNLELVYDSSARRFEGGSANNITLAGMGASFDLLLDAGVDQVWQYVDSLNDHLVAGLTDLGADVLSDRSPTGRSAIVVFSVPGVDGEELCSRLGDDGFVCAPRGGGVRVAPHGYNTIEEIDRFLRSVEIHVPVRR